MKRTKRFALIAGSLLASACASDSATAPADTFPLETRLSAVAAVPSATVTDPTVTMKVTVTSSLQENVSGGVCAQTIEARPGSGSAWTDVTSSTAVCSALAVVLPPGGSITMNAVADQAKIRAAVGSSTSTVVLRARSKLFGANSSYMLQSSEVTWQLP